MRRVEEFEMSFNKKAISLGLAVVLAGAVIASGLAVKKIGLKGGEQDLHRRLVRLRQMSSL